MKMTLLIQITIGLLSLLVGYFILKPFLTTIEARVKLLKFYLILTPFALGFLLFAIYYYSSGQPASFKKGLEALISDKKILSKIGDYKSYSFFKDSLPKEKDNPAKFKIQLNGSEAKIYLECTMQKDKFGNWSLKELKEDSLIKKQ